MPDFHFPEFFPHPESNAVLLAYDTLAHGSAFRVQLQLIWFTVHALLKRYSYLQHRRKSLPRCSHTHPDSLTQTFIPRPHAPTPVTCEGQTPKIRQLLGKSCWFFTLSWKRKKHRGCIWPSPCYVCVLTHGSNTECPFTSTHKDSNLSLHAACSDFRIHRGAFPKNNSSLWKWNKAQLILIWPSGREGRK